MWLQNDLRNELILPPFSQTSFCDNSQDMKSKKTNDLILNFSYYQNFMCQRPSHKYDHYLNLRKINHLCQYHTQSRQKPIH